MPRAVGRARSRLIPCTTVLSRKPQLQYSLLVQCLRKVLRRVRRGSVNGVPRHLLFASLMKHALHATVGTPRGLARVSHSAGTLLTLNARRLSAAT